MNPQILYKVHGRRDCDLLQIITRYVYWLGYDIRPNTIIERCFPEDISVLPSIVSNNGKFIEGLDMIVTHYENVLKVNDLLNKSLAFNNVNPGYKITDRSTHKNVIAV